MKTETALYDTFLLGERTVSFDILTGRFEVYFMEIVRCTASDAGQLAVLNRQLIEDEGSDNPMTIEELETRMKGFLETGYDAYFFTLQGEVIGYALVSTKAAPLYLRQFFIGRDHRREHRGTEAFRLLMGELETDSVDVEVLSWNEPGARFWESLGFVERSRYLRFSSRRQDTQSDG